jgi:hypothetical protein
MDYISQKSHNINLTSAEVGVLWNLYMHESMVHHMITCLLKHIEDINIREFFLYTHDTMVKSLDDLESFHRQENLPVPRGITSEDINPNAARLFTDKYCIYLAEFMSKFALSNFCLAYTQCSRLDLKEFIKKHYVERLIYLNQKSIELSLTKGVHIPPPYVPTLKEVDFVKNKDFLAGFFTEKRQLTVLEITQLFNNAYNNSIGIATMTAYSQVAKSEEIRKHFLKGKSISTKLYEDFCNKLNEENIPIPPKQTDLVTDCTESPYSDRLMLFNDIILSNAGLANYGMAIAGSSRHDLVALFGKAAVETGAYLEGGTKLMISNRWMEQPPQAVRHENIIAT